MLQTLQCISVCTVDLRIPVMVLLIGRVANMASLYQRLSSNGLISSGSSLQTEDTTRSTIPSDHRVALWLALYPSALHCTRNANGGY